MNADEATDTIDAARRLQRALYRAAKASPERRFHALYDKMYREDILTHAYQLARSNQGAPGVDCQSFGEIESKGSLTPTSQPLGMPPRKAFSTFSVSPPEVEK